MKNLLFILCFVVFSASTLQEEIRSYRLPTDVTPIHYSLRIRPYVDEEVFDGEVSIHVRAKNVLDKVILHSSSLNITEAFINRVVAEFKNEDDEKLSLRYANESIQPGEHVLFIKYKGTLQRQEIGFTKSPFSYNGEEGHLLVTDFEPSSARKAFPCFDEPAFKSKFNIRLVAPDDTYKAISNMPEINRFTTPQGVVYDFATSVTMSTYLVSFALTKYSYYEDLLEEPDRTVPIRVYTYNASQENNQFAVNCTKRALQFYTEYTNISYPLPKLDMIEYDRPQSAATENWGLITFREGLLTLNLDIFDASQIKVVMYHELAHFWFGNLVTNDFWNDLWLQEGFATYMSYKLYLAESPGMKLNESRTFFFDGYEEASEKLPSNPIVYYLTSQKLLEQRFDRIVYNKGPSILLMLENVIGEKAFQQVIRKFLKKHAFKTATTNDFISTVEEVVPDVHLRGFLESYLYQSRFPIVKVVRSDGKFILQQETCATVAKFLSSGERWTIPITYITDTNKTPTLKWFDQDMDQLVIEEPSAKWILFNKHDVGVYKVNFSDDSWNDLVEHFEDLSLEESQLLINEATYSFKFGIIDCTVLFTLMKHVNHQKQWIYLFEFHDIIVTELTCSGYKEEVEMYMNFLRKRFNETKVPKKPNLYHQNCTNISEIKKANIKLGLCVKWIRDNLSSKSKDAPENLASR
ncbi:puromycin-sensitive aminopeptidase-like protein isoform X1 [Anoplophora glabripennis]|uniref:puromycin-sensitive aminopeptidase-like protein isoform X1 n=1 Tax=Anoplophora glabripennis TaxID=217634 RepID=UPI00087431F9|nr:puromycin-sensitive aminopeptidase-like protein isoform X1 [Anoplophora glabripennis]